MEEKEKFTDQWQALENALGMKKIMEILRSVDGTDELKERRWVLMVKDFVKKSAAVVGKYNSEMFNFNTISEFVDFDINSPIEQLFYCALKTLQEINEVKDVSVWGCPNDPDYYMSGIDIKPQEKIGKYRVDFAVNFYRVWHKGHKTHEESVLVECDSQEWHERTEEQRRYEKARDRYFLKEGYKIFHFTGREIMDNPYKPAQEVLLYVMGLTDSDIITMPE